MITPRRAVACCRVPNRSQPFRATKRCAQCAVSCVYARLNAPVAALVGEPAEERRSMRVIENVTKKVLPEVRR